jgi:L-lactate dehydrogenase
VRSKDAGLAPGHEGTGSVSGTSVGIVGTGGVGVACAWSILLQGLAGQVTLYNRTPERALGEARDFQHAMPLLPRCEVRGRGLDAIESEDVLVIAVGRHTTPGVSRLDVLDQNLDVMDATAEAIEAGGLPRIAIVVSSPLDVLTEYLTRRWAGRGVSVMGSGTSLDTLRFAERLAHECQIHPRTVHAWVIGEHGDSSVFLFESATIGALPLARFAEQRGFDIGADWRARIEQDVRTAAYAVRDLKGSATHGIGLAVGGLLRCIGRESEFVIPVSVRVADGLCASLPCALGPDGTGPPLIPTMSDPERAAWERSLETLAKVNARLPN